jgi:hypothetical protein
MFAPEFPGLEEFLRLSISARKSAAATFGENKTVVATTKKRNKCETGQARPQEKMHAFLSQIRNERVLEINDR